MLSSASDISDDEESNYADEEDVLLSTSSCVHTESRDDDESTWSTRSLSDTETASATSSTVSLLDVLKASTVSDLSRKRSIARNSPCGKRRSRPRSTSFDPKNVKPHYQKSADMGTFIKIFRNQWAHNE